MALQTQNLVLIGLGMQDDTPPQSIQPRLVDGIHLRWAFKRALGFPWNGFYLFRRSHDEGTPICLGSALASFVAGPLNTFTLDVTGHGQFRSDRFLLLTEDFSPPDRVELDLAKRSYLAFEFLPGEPARAVEVTIGFRSDVKIEVTALCQNTPVAATVISGSAGQLVKAVLEFDMITALKLSAGPAAVVDLCYVPVSQNATAGWEPIAAFSYPFSLPVTHPDYPARPGAGEKLAAMRDLARSRVRYGDPNQFTAFPVSLESGGTISVVNGSAIVIGTGTAWDEALLGKVLQVKDDDTAYTIIMVVSPSRLVLSRDYVGVSGGGRTYAINQDTFGELHDSLVHLVRGGSPSTAMADRFLPLPAYNAGTISVVRDSSTVTGIGTNWSSAFIGLALHVADEEAIYTVANVQSATQLTLERGYQGASATGKAYVLSALLMSSDPQGNVPRMSKQYPLDLVLLGSLEPALAQMLGLYWIDEQAELNVSYDYLLLADYQQRFNNIGPEEIIRFVVQTGFSQVEGAIAFKQIRVPASPLPAPRDVRVYALPGGTRLNSDGTLADVSNNAGLTWEQGVTSLGVLLPAQPILFHLWRADVGEAEPANAVPADEHTLITVAQEPAGLPPEKRPPRPILNPRPSSQNLAWPSNWPQFSLQATDQRLAEGWYSYEVSGIDIFGRHSTQSSPAAWYQWTPAPDPRPWYYQDPPADRQVHPFAVRLLDKIPPPPPAAVEAYALDPADPVVLRDKAYNVWRAALSPEQRDVLVGLRVSWAWTEASMRQAPDTREFRLYFHPGTNPPAPDPSLATHWEQRYYVVGFEEHVTLTTDATGRPLRVYQVLLPGPNDMERGLALTPTLAEPVVYAHVGVSAVDSRTHALDDPKWNSSDWGGRFGNEGRVAAPVKIFRVLRQPPPPPGVPPPDSDKVYATSADYHARSYYTYRWLPQLHLKTHIFRALDDTLFKTDWRRRQTSASSLSATDEKLFPLEWRGTDPSLTAKRQQIADDLNRLNTFGHDAAGSAQAQAYYQRLGNDSLRVLAGLPDNEEAFTQVTILPLDPDDPALANRPGPDNPQDFSVDPALRLFIDQLDGRSTNRYFYRAAYVDGAHNRSELSLASPPIYLPKVVPPQTPTLTKVLGGDQQITLRWASNREPDLAEYRIYRAESKEAIRDLRLMTWIHTDPIVSGEPTARPAEVEWTDTKVPSLVPIFYRVTAVDEAGNVSPPSPPVSAQAFDDSRPAPPVWNGTVAVANGLELHWILADLTHRALLQRRDVFAYPPQWTNVTSWLAAGVQQAVDKSRENGRAYSYRIRVRDGRDRVNRDFNDLEV